MFCFSVFYFICGFKMARVNIFDENKSSKARQTYTLYEVLFVFTGTRLITPPGELLVPEAIVISVVSALVLT